MRCPSVPSAVRLLLPALLAGVVACGDDGTGVDGGGDAAALNFFEQELVGLWSRFHSFDGSSEYWRFNADRTACKWEEPSGSNSRLDQSNYAGWSIDEDDTLGSGRYRVVVQGSGLTQGLTFDYTGDRLWPTSFTNLVFTPSSSAKTC